MSDKQIMLIEDNPDDRDLTIRALKKNNVLNPVTVATNGGQQPVPGHRQRLRRPALATPPQLPGVTTP